MRLIDGMLSIPSLLMAMAIVGILGANIRNTTIAMAITFTPGFARLIRGQVLATKEDVYVEAARVAGASHSRIIRRHIVPNAIAPIIVQVLMVMGLALLVEGTLSYLGLSVKPPGTSLGTLLQRGFSFKERTQRGSSCPDSPSRRCAGPSTSSPTVYVTPSAARRSVGRRDGDAAERLRLRFVSKLTPVWAPLDVSNLSIEVKRYGHWVRVVDDVSLSIGEGETLGLVGESGSGKSLTASAIMRLLPQSVKMVSGTVLFGKRDISALSNKDFNALRGPQLSMVFQDPQNSLNPAYTVGNQLIETIRAHAEIDKHEAKKRAVDLLSRVGIENPADRLGDYPHQFCGGMAQRVMIALAIASQPKLLIADEPTTALDVTVQAQILRLLQSLRDEYGMSLLLISHDLSVIAEMCDRVAVMYAGQLVEAGRGEHVFLRPSHPYTEALLRSHPGVHTKGGQLVTIPGTVPDPSAMPAGCRFHTRCAYAVAECPTTAPQLVDHKVTLARCLRADQLDLQGVASHETTHAAGDAAHGAANGAANGAAAVVASGADTDRAGEVLMQLTHLTKEYAIGGGVFGKAKRLLRAVDDVTIDIRQGESVGLVGESGAGKSTVGRLVLGLTGATSGTFSFTSGDLFGDKEARKRYRRDVQVVFQNPFASLDPLMTVGDIVAEPIDVHFPMDKSARVKRVGELLGQVGLDESYRFRYPHQLSGGQRQRIAIARALATSPKLIVCDEPVSSLDVSTQAQVINLLKSLQRELGIAYLFVGHDLEVVRHISDQVAVMYLGRIVEWGPSDEVYANPKHPYTRMLLASVLSVDPRERRLHRSANDPGLQESPQPGACPYAPRCPDARDLCRSEDPVPVTIGRVSVRCNLYA